MKYPFRVYLTKVEDHQFWVAECSLLKGCVAQGETPEEAIDELEINEAEWLQTAKEYGIPIPEIPLETDNEYSGKFTVRVSPAVHKAAAEIANKQGISLNQYVNDAIVSQNSAITTSNYVCFKVKEAVKTLKDQISLEVTYGSKNSQTYSSEYDMFNLNSQYNISKYPN